MWLRRNHVLAALRYPQFRDNLAAYVAIAEQAWAHVDLSWLTTAYAALDARRLEHSAVPSSEQAALL